MRLSVFCICIFLFFSCSETPNGVTTLSDLPPVGDSSSTPAPTESADEQRKKSLVDPDPGFFSSSVSLKVIPREKDESFFFTTDGSVPNEKSERLTDEIKLQKTTVVRLASQVNRYWEDLGSFTYFVSEPNENFLVVSIAADPILMFDPEVGMYPNIDKEIEIGGQIEFFEPKNARVLQQGLAIELSGKGSLASPQKSLNLKAKSAYGPKSFNYPFFPELGIKSFNRLLLRNSGQDNNVTHLRDAFVSDLVRNASDQAHVISPTKINHQAYRPASVYINGKYWGIYGLREKMDQNYVESRFGIKSSQVDVIENESEIKSGDLVEWGNLMNFLNQNNFSERENFDKLSELIDIEPFIDYMAFQMWVDNTDWPSNNVVRFRERKIASKWQYLVKDLDFTFGVIDLAAWVGNQSIPSQDALGRLLDGTSKIWPNEEWSTRPFRKSMEYPPFRRQFALRAADMMNTLFFYSRVESRLEQFRQAQAPYMQRQFDRWLNGVNQWDQNLEKLREFARARSHFVKEHILRWVSEAESVSRVQLLLEPANAGELTWNTLKINQSNSGLVGEYFSGIEVPFVASAKAGYRFSHLTINGQIAMGNLAKLQKGQNEVVAHFK